MDKLIIVLAVLVFIIIGFIWNRWPLWLTAMSGLMILVLTGTLTLQEAFAGFTDQGVILTVAIYILTEGFLKTSVLGKVRKFLPDSAQKERQVVILFLILTLVLSQFIGGISILCAFYPLLLILERESGISRSRLVYPIMLISYSWGAITPFGYGASTPYLFNSILEQFGSEARFQVWDYFIGVLPMALATLLFTCLWGYRLLPKQMEHQADESGLKTISLEGGQLSPKKEKLACLIFGATISLMIVGSFWGLNSCTIVVCGALLMVICGILKEKEAFDAIWWPIVFMIAALLPISSAMNNSGAGEIIAEWIQRLLGNTENPYVIQAVFFFFPAILTQFISNVAADRIVEPMAIATTMSMGINPIPVLLGSAFGAGLSMLTPMSTPGMTLAFGLGGYSLKSFFRAGLIPFLLNAAAAIFLIPLLFPF